MILLLLSSLCISLVDLFSTLRIVTDVRIAIINKCLRFVYMSKVLITTHMSRVWIVYVDKFLASILNIPTFSHVNLHIQMSSSVALSLDISPFVAWYLDCRGNDGYMWSFVKPRHRDVRLCTIMCVQTSGISYEKGQITQILCR